MRYSSVVGWVKRVEIQSALTVVDDSIVDDGVAE